MNQLANSTEWIRVLQVTDIPVSLVRVSNVTARKPSCREAADHRVKVQQALVDEGLLMVYDNVCHEQALVNRPDSGRQLTKARASGLFFWRNNMTIEFMAVEEIDGNLLPIEQISTITLRALRWALKAHKTVWIL